MTATDDNNIKTRNALTYINVLERFGKYTLVEARLVTGRTHQIRVHLSAMGYPILGDTLYGPIKQPFKTDGQALHAKSLAFNHPATDRFMQIDTALPEHFLKARAKAESRDA
jgi:23S rRNA pseudouridine1911/1915/1917 synthase